MAELGKTLLIANPVAQNGKGLKAAEKAQQSLLFAPDIELTTAFTEHPKHATKIAQESESFDTVIVLGGDGAIHEAANGLMKISADKRPTLGIIPVGSGNDYARTLGMSTKVDTAIRQLFSALPRKVDVGCCNGEYFVETLSFGLDAAIALDTVERRKHTKKTDTALYFEAGIDQLKNHLDTYTFTLKLDDKDPMVADVKMLAVQIGATYGGGFKVCPDAKVDDGVFDLCWADSRIKVGKAIFTFIRAKSGKHVKSKYVNFAKASKISLSFDRRPPCQIDGEAHIADSYEITIEKAALNALFATN